MSEGRTQPRGGSPAATRPERTLRGRPGAMPWRESLHSDQWPDVAPLVLRLRASARVGRQRQRGRLQYVYHDTLTRRTVRVNHGVHAFVGRMDGATTVGSIWDTLVRVEGDEVPTQAELIESLQRLAALGLIEARNGMDMARLLDIESTRRERELFAAVNPLAFRLSLGNPSTWIDRTLPFVRWIMSPAVLVVVGLLTLLAGLSALSELSALRGYLVQEMGTQRFVLCSAAVYPVLKAVHEYAHAALIHHFGGRVRACGLTVMLLMPIPFVDASDASLFGSRSRRVAVSLAGIAVEVVVAAIAYGVWTSVSDGHLRLAAFAIMFTAMFSTVVVNANPLMRFDGYHAFSDLVGIPNLGPRSQAVIAFLARRIIAGERDAVAPEGSPSEWLLLVLYGVAAWLYQWVVAWLALTWLIDLSRPAAAVVACLFGAQLVARPLARIVRYVLRRSRRTRHRARLWGAAAAATVAVLVLPWIVSVPETVVLDGVVVGDEGAQLRAPEDGFVKAVPVATDTDVAAGTVLLQLWSPRLEQELRMVEAEIAEAEAVRVSAEDSVDSMASCVAYDAGCDALRAAGTGAGSSGADPLASGRGSSGAGGGAGLSNVQRMADAQSRLAQLRRQRTVLQARVESLQMRAASAGRFQYVDANGPLWRQVRQGDLLAVVNRPGPSRATLVGDGTVGDRLPKLAHATLRYADEPRTDWMAELSARAPAATLRLPVAALGDQSGGPVPTDPADREGLQALAPVFIVDVRSDRSQPRLGSRLKARFDLPPRPVGMLLADALRRLLLRRLEF